MKSVSFRVFLPNFITFLALCAGASAIRFALMGQLEAAVVSFLIAAFLDACDGFAARALNGQTEFGAQLDALADMVSFGVSPAVIVYVFNLSGAPGLYWLACLFYIAATAFRLARFKTDEGESHHGRGFFKGLPAPGAAFLALLPLFLLYANGGAVFVQPPVVATLLVLVALLMVSRLPTPSLKNIGSGKKGGYIIAAFTVIILVLLANYFWLTLAALGCLYILSLPISAYRAHK